uniref:G_PROTEIN_RECEP_F2_4 domain-containing protein n=1 Tax=Panagrellus redivivus TaxID=6233 RepID=A0A7E4VKV7_PANRE
MRRILVFCLLFAALGLGQCTSVGIKPNKPEPQIPEAIDCSQPNLPGFIKSICASRELGSNQQNADLTENLAEKDPIKLLRNPYLRNTPLRVFVILFGVISLIILLGALVIYLAHVLKSHAPAGLQKYNFLCEAFYDSHISFKTKLFTLFYVVTLLVFVFVFITLSDRKTLGGNGGCWFIAGFNYYLITTLCTLSIILLFRVMVEFGKWKPRIYSVVNFFGGEVNILQPIFLAFVIPAVLLLIFGMSYNRFLKRTDDFCWIRSDHRFPSIGVPVIMHIISLLLLIPILARRFPHLGISRMINKFFMAESDLESYSIEEGRPKGAITDVHTHLPSENCAYWWHFVPQAFLGLAAIFEAVSYTHNHTTFWHVMFSLLLTLKVPTLFALRLWHWKRHRAQHVIHAEEDVGRGVTVRKTLTDTAQLPDNFAPAIHAPDLDTISEHFEPSDDVQLQVLGRDAELQSLHSKLSGSRTCSRKSSAVSCLTEGSANKASTADVDEHHAVYDEVPLDARSECSHVSHASHESAYSIEELAVTEELPEIPFEVEVHPSTPHGILKKSHTIFDSDDEADAHGHHHGDHEVLERQDTLDAPPKPPRGITPQGSVTKDTSSTPPPTPLIEVGEGALPWWSKTLQSEGSESAALEHLHEALSGEYSDEENAVYRRESQTVAVEFSSDSDVAVENVNIVHRENELEYVPLEDGGNDVFHTPRSTRSSSTESVCSSDSSKALSEPLQREHTTDAHHTVIENEVITHFEGIANATINVYVRKFSVDGTAKLSFEPVFTDLPFDTASVTTTTSLAPSLTSLLEIGHGVGVETASIGHGAGIENIFIGHGSVSQKDSIGHGAIVTENIGIGHGAVAEHTFSGHGAVTEKSSLGHGAHAEAVGRGARINEESLTSAWKSSAIEDYGHRAHQQSDNASVLTKTESRSLHHHENTHHESHLEETVSNIRNVVTTEEHHVSSPLPLRTTDVAHVPAPRSLSSSRTSSDSTLASLSKSDESVTDTEEVSINHPTEPEPHHVIHDSHELHHQHPEPLAESKFESVETSVEFDITHPGSTASEVSLSSKSTSVTSSSATPTASVESLSSGSGSEENLQESGDQPVLHDTVHEAITHSISQSLLAADATTGTTNTTTHVTEATDTATRVENIETNVEIGWQEAESAAIVLSAAPVDLPVEYASDSTDASTVRRSADSHDGGHDAVVHSHHPTESEPSERTLSEASDEIPEHQNVYPTLTTSTEPLKTADVTLSSHHFEENLSQNSAQYPSLNHEFGHSETSFTTHSYGNKPSNFSSLTNSDGRIQNYPDLHGTFEHGIRSISSRPPLHHSSFTSQSSQFSSTSASTFSESKSSTIPRPTPRRSLYYDDL